MQNIQVLIMEDDFRVAAINKKFTETVAGFEVCGIASTIQEAKKMLPILEPDLVLLDVYFPDGDGVEMLRYIRNHHRSTDVILITAAKEIDVVQEAIRGGVIDYIIKPVMLDRFEKTLHKYTEHRTRLNKISDIDQQEIDQLLHNGRNEFTKEPDIPKGIDPLTLKKIQEKLSILTGEGVTAEEFGQSVGMSRTTTRRYLEYMVSIDTVSAELAYGQVGRPERLYRLKEEKS